MHASLSDLAMHLHISTPTRDREYQTCPVCSAYRTKTREKCLVVRTGPDGIRVHCHHCGHEGAARYGEAA